MCNTAESLRLTSQKQKDTAGIPEYARKGKAALSKESFSLQGKQEYVFSLLSQQTVLPHTLPSPVRSSAELTARRQLDVGDPALLVACSLSSTYTLLTQLLSLYRDIPVSGCFTCKIKNNFSELIQARHQHL